MAIFTAADIFRSATYQAPELDSRPVEPGVIIDIFNDRLSDLVLDAVSMDDERLAAEIDVPADVVALDPVDLTNDGTGTGAIDFLSIAYIDWLDVNGDGDEVWIHTIEARNRAGDTYADKVCGILVDQMRKLRKLTDWSGVSTLRVYGVAKPTLVVEDKVQSLRFDYPAALRSALVWEILATLAPYVGIKDANRLQYWETHRAAARERMLADASNHAGSRIEELPGGSQR